MNSQEDLLTLIETGKPLEIKRALAVRMSIKGYSRAEIADLLNISLQFIDKWKPIYFERGVAGLKLGYRGSKGYLSAPEREAIIAYIRQHEEISSDALKTYIKDQYEVEYNSAKSYTDLLNVARLNTK